MAEESSQRALLNYEIAWDLGEKLPAEEVLDLVQEIVAILTKIIR